MHLQCMSELGVGAECEDGLVCSCGPITKKVQCSNTGGLNSLQRVILRAFNATDHASLLRGDFCLGLHHVGDHMQTSSVDKSVLVLSLQQLQDGSVVEVRIYTGMHGGR